MDTPPQQLIVDPPQRIQRRRKKGWLPSVPNPVFVGSPSRYANPFKVGHYYKKGDADSSYRGPFQMIYTHCLADKADATFTLIETPEQALEWYRWYLSVCNWKFVQELRGKNMACWCEIGKACHGDLLLEFANLPMGNNDS